MQRAREWYGSPAYARALAYRAAALERRLLFVEGSAGVAPRWPVDEPSPGRSDQDHLA